MKNKQIFARIFALLFAMALVVALALPCFAFETDEELNALRDSFLDYYGLDYSLASFIANNIPIEDFITLEYLYTTDYTVSYNKPFIGSYYLFYGAEMSQGNMYIDCDVEAVALSVADEVSIYHSSNLSYEWVSHDYITFSLFASDTEVIQYRWEYNQASNQYFLADAFYNSVELPDGTVVQMAICGLNVTLQDDFFIGMCDDCTRYDPRAFGEGAYVYNIGSTPGDTPDGMYGQLYSILRSSLFGDGTLTPDQQFTLTQTAMWLSWAVILVPIIICVCITVKLLRF